MKSRVLYALAGALTAGLIVVGAGAAAGVRIPAGSIGIKKLTPQLAKLVKEGAEPGQQGPAGKDGATGPAGITGAPGANADEVVFPYSAVLAAGETADLASIGPLTLVASCESEGEDTVRGKVDVASNLDGLHVNGKPLNHGSSMNLQKVTVSGGGEEEGFPAIIRATNEDGSFALQGISSALIELPGGCHFFGTLIEDS
jgi:hypothetical protein